MIKHFVMCWIFSVWMSNGYAADCKTDWPYWDAFAKNHIQKDGRIIDFDAQAITTSEGQSYALFFSLVANDRANFDQILKWTINNLAKGDFKKNLPGWKWGKAFSGGKWLVLDENSASDADLWIAYSLFQAADHWGDDRYHQLANQLLANIEKDEVVDLPGLGKMLMPGKVGFHVNEKTWRINPSYLPIQLLRNFSIKNPQGPWLEIAENTEKMLAASTVRGIVPDWVAYKSNVGFVDDVTTGHVSSFDAIRVYLWWAMLNKNDPLFVKIGDHLKDAEQFSISNRFLPERIMARVGEEQGVAPSGFVGALAPYRFVLFNKYPQEGWPPLDIILRYYDNVLNLFGYGWLERRFWFNLDGSLTMRSHLECSK